MTAVASLKRPCLVSPHLLDDGGYCEAIMKENFYVFYIYTTKYCNFLTLLWNRELGSRQLMNLLIALLVNMASKNHKVKNKIRG